MAPPITTPKRATRLTATVLVFMFDLTYPDAQNIAVYDEMAKISPKFISGMYAQESELVHTASCDTQK